MTRPNYLEILYFGNCFALRAGQEHRNLRMKNSQLSLHTDESGAEYLQYVEDVSKVIMEARLIYELRIRLLEHMKMLRNKSAVL